MAGWYYSINNEQLGPVSAKELKRLAGSGQLQPDNLVRKDGTDDWTKAGGVNGLFPSDNSSDSAGQNESFDAYRKWLGIPRKDQPPTHYRLLGVEQFESDPDVIDTAANKQMAYLHGCATGEHADIAEQLLNEISAARLCLLDVAKKVAYDSTLPPKIEPFSPATKRTRHTTTWIAASFVLIVIVAGGVWWVNDDDVELDSTSHEITNNRHTSPQVPTLQQTSGKRDSLSLASSIGRSNLTPVESVAKPLDFDLDLTDVTQAESFQGRYYHLSGDTIHTDDGVVLRDSSNRGKRTGWLTLVNRLSGDFNLQIEYRFQKGNGVDDSIRVTACGVPFRAKAFGDHKIQLIRERDKLIWIHDFDPPYEVTLVFPRSVVDTSLDIGATFHPNFSGRPTLTIRRLKLSAGREPNPKGGRKTFSLPKDPIQTIDLADNEKTTKSLQFRRNSAAPVRHTPNAGQWTIQDDGIRLTGLTDVISKQEFRGDFVMTLEYVLTGKSAKHNAVHFEMWGHRFVSKLKGHRNVILCRSGDTLYLCDGNEVLESFTLPEHAKSRPSPVKITLWHHWQFNNWPSMVIRRLTLQGDVK